MHHAQRRVWLFIAIISVITIITCLIVIIIIIITITITILILFHSRADDGVVHHHEHRRS